MKTVLKFEELAVFILAIALLYWLGVSWWYYLLLLLGPDISMLAYAGGNKIGAFFYNLFHHKGMGVVLILCGLFIGDLEKIPAVLYAGIIVIGHSAMDRLFGYGLKYEKGFKFTHLGEIGRKE